MSRSLPNAALAELYVADTDAVWLVLLTISHADLALPLRLVNDVTNLVSNGNTFTALGFLARLPADRTGPPRLQLVLDGVDRTLVTAIRSIITPAAVLVQLVRRSAPDTILRSWDLDLRGASYDAQTVTLELAPEPVLDESYPGTDFTPLLFPGMFDR